MHKKGRDFDDTENLALNRNPDPVKVTNAEPREFVHAQKFSAGLPTATQVRDGVLPSIFAVTGFAAGLMLALINSKRCIKLKCSL